MIAVKMTTVIYLRQDEGEEDELGQRVPEIKKRKVLAFRKSVKESEFYKAGQQGLKPEIAFEIRKEEYHGEMEVEENEVYVVIRNTETNNGIELVCAKKAGNAE